MQPSTPLKDARPSADNQRMTSHRAISRNSFWSWLLLVGPLVGCGWALVTGQWLVALLAAALAAAYGLHLLGYPVGTLLQLLYVGLSSLGITLVALYVVVRETIHRDAYWQELVFFGLLAVGVMGFLTWMGLYRAYLAVRSGDALHAGGE